MAALLVQVFFSAANGVRLAATVGLAVAPLIGWRSAPAAVHRKPAWARDALRSVLLIAAAIIVGMVVLQAVYTDVRGWILERLFLVLYAIIIDTMLVGFFTLVTTLLVGFPWALVMRQLRRAPHRP